MNTKEIIKKDFEEFGNKYVDVVTKMVDELESKGIIIDEEACNIIAKRTKVVYFLGFNFGVRSHCKVERAKINEIVKKFSEV